MAVELLEAVRKAEEQAEQIRREAAENAREMMKATEESILQNTRQGAAEIRGAYQQQMSLCQRDAEARIAAKAGERQAALNALKAQARENLPRAAALIAERIIGHGNR